MSGVEVVEGDGGSDGLVCVVGRQQVIHLRPSLRPPPIPPVSRSPLAHLKLLSTSRHCLWCGGMDKGSISLPTPLTPISAGHSLPRTLS